MKKNIISILLITFAILMNKSEINAAKVSNGYYSLLGKKINISDIETYSFYDINKVKELCFYFNMEETEDNLLIGDDISGYDISGDIKILFIYDDGTASIGWNGSGCNRTTSSGKCVDGFKTNTNIRKGGIKNWSANPTGVDKNLSENLDAYKYYEEFDECPAYLAQSENFGANYFYISTGYKSSAFSKIESKISKLEGTNYFYYNFGEEKTNFTSAVTCKYSENQDDDSEQFKIDFSKNGDAKLSYSQNISINMNGEKKIMSFVHMNSRLFSLSYLKQIEANKCPKALESCIGPAYLEAGDGITIIGDKSIVPYLCTADKTKTFYCVGENCSDEDICQVYTDYRDDIDSVLKIYKESKDSTEKRDALNDYNVLKDELNSYCSAILKTQNYAEGNCLSACLKITNDLAQLEVTYGIRSGYSNEKCNIGVSILSMVYNVLKWAKYIAPILVIILSILDFIKAIAAQNDDDMKKAQGKFVKRLIVAALLFLLPLIINFMLKTFGLYNSECDISNLFSAQMKR